MKKVFVLIMTFMLVFSSLAYAGGVEYCGSKGKGSTGETGSGQVTQKRGG